MSSTTIARLRLALEEHDNELGAARNRVTVLEQQREHLAHALDAIEKTAVPNGAAKKKPKAKPKANGPIGLVTVGDDWMPKNGEPVTADHFVKAVQALGGDCTTKELVELLEVENGNVLTGARTAAIRDGRVRFDAGTYSIV